MWTVSQEVEKARPSRGAELRGHRKGEVECGQAANRPGPGWLLAPGPALPQTQRHFQPGFSDIPWCPSSNFPFTQSHHELASLLGNQRACD